ncbi:DUF2730 family protein [Xanthobacter sp. KR7-225]|uniref:DUF2730 family protein n=1 Tax=Xanthobacter sp. KR7-225 TaxID=3156613 RepID=UPI0032B3C8BA
MRRAHLACPPGSAAQRDAVHRVPGEIRAAETVSMEDLRLWAPIVIAVFALLSPWIMYGRTARRTEITELSSKITALGPKLEEKASAGHVGNLEDRLDRAEERITRAESRLEYVPDKDSSHRLEMAIARLEGKVELMDEKLKPVSQMANRVHERMFEEAAR